jgi:hypothetical protein
MRLLQFAKDIYSQNGEDGILAAILETIGTADKWCVEFGAWDGQHFSNTCNLIENQGYSAVMIEASKQRFEDLLKRYGSTTKVIAQNRFVGFTQNDGLDTILASTPIPKNFDLLSIDIDGNDYHVWNAVSTYTPKVVCIEYNPTIPTEIAFIQPAQPEVSQGSSLLALTQLGTKKGYELVCVTALNAIFVRSEYFPLFQIANNDPHLLRENVAFITHVFCGYDGTIFIAGNGALPWHGLTYSSRLRKVPKVFRCFPGNFGRLKQKAFGVYKTFSGYLSRS